MSETIEINIEELVLHNFQQTDRRRLNEALHIALTQAFSQNNIVPFNASTSLHAVDGGSFNMHSKSKPAEIAGSIAQSVQTSVSGSGKNTNK